MKTQMDNRKRELIKEFILGKKENKENFEMAIDLFNSFQEIENGIVGEISSEIIETVEDPEKKIFRDTELLLNLKYEHHIRFRLEGGILLQAAYQNYFKSLNIWIKCESKNIDFGTKPDFFKEIEIWFSEDSSTNIRQQNDVTALEITDYPFNKIDSQIKLFELYHNEENLRKELISATQKYLVPNLIKLAGFFEKHKY